jgi:hypothetical protein
MNLEGQLLLPSAQLGVKSAPNFAQNLIQMAKRWKNVHQKHQQRDRNWRKATKHEDSSREAIMATEGGKGQEREGLVFGFD